MRATSNTRRVLSVALVLVVAGAAWGVWSQRMMVRPGETGPKAAPPFVRLSGAGRAAGDRVLQERSEFFDPTPLFLPTPRNAGQGGLPPKLVAQPGQVFRDFPAKPGIGQATLPPYGTDVVSAPEGLADVMSRANEAPFAGLGETGQPARRVEPRAAFIEVKSMQGRVVLRIPVAAAPVPRADFSPMEFMANLNPAGLVGDPLLVSGSGVEEVDNFFRDYLVRSVRLGEKLAPGAYRVLIGP